MTFLWYTVALGLGGVQALGNRFRVDQDGLTYLDMARELAAGNWPGGLSSTYHPGFSLFLNATLGLLRPSAYFESTVVLLSCWLGFGIALLAFEFFLRQLQTVARGISPKHGIEALEPLHNSYAILLCRLAFLWCSLNLIDVSRISPDMLVSAAVYAAAGLLVRIRGGDLRVRVFVALGVVMGVGFWIKEVWGPLALLFGSVATLLIWRQRGAVRRIGLCVLCFSLVALPLCLLLSRLVGACTCGRTGAWNVFRFAGGYGSPVHWDGGPEGSGVPKHPSRILHRDPTVYEFGSPIPGTYPPLYDQVYWFDGFVARFNPARHLPLLRHSLVVYKKMLKGTGLSFFLAAMLLVCMARWSDLLSTTRSLWWLFAPAAAGMLMYAIVYTEPRYIGAFLTLIFVGIVQLRFEEREAVRVARTAALFVIVGWFLSVAYDGLRTFLHTVPGLTVRGGSFDHRDWFIAKELQRLGVRSGGSLGYIGMGYAFYWARLAGCRVVAEVRQQDLTPTGYSGWVLSESERARRQRTNTDVEMFWAEDASARRPVLDAFRSAGVRAVVAQGVPQGADTTGWLSIPNTDLFVYFIPAAFSVAR